MTKFYEYELEDGLTILVEGDEDLDNEVPASNIFGATVIKARKNFDSALATINIQARKLHAKLEKLEADEVQVIFGLKTTGELGSFAVAKINLEANYEVTLKWKKKDELYPPRHTRIHSRNS